LDEALRCPEVGRRVAHLPKSVRTALEKEGAKSGSKTESEESDLIERIPLIMGSLWEAKKSMTVV
jgi:hypothetical protein